MGMSYGLALVALTMLVGAGGKGVGGADWVDTSPHYDAFVITNGVRLEYLDWGGGGTTLILIHGAGDNPHIFDDLAPGLTDRYHVLAYARRGCGGSESRGPYDTATLTEDLRGLMDALNIRKADLVGWSQGGNEATEMAGEYPDRVGRIVYLDAGYDWSDADFVAAFHAIPAGIRDPPQGAMDSLASYFFFEKAVTYPPLVDLRRVEAYLRESVVVGVDGRLHSRMSEDAEDGTIEHLLADRRDYTRVHAPVLAIYAETFLNLNSSDIRERATAVAWESKYMKPFRRKSIDRVQREISGVSVAVVPGAHDSFFLTSRGRVLAAMRAFLPREP
jgi:pimeloyl-ACP methyl ester carboxylesterase